VAPLGLNSQLYLHYQRVPRLRAAFVPGDVLYQIAGVGKDLITTSDDVSIAAGASISKARS
jgi:hypothetical protein